MAAGCGNYPVVHAKPGTPVAEVIQRFGPPSDEWPYVWNPEGPGVCDEAGEVTRALGYEVPPRGTLERKLFGLYTMHVVCVDGQHRVRTVAMIEH